QYQRDYAHAAIEAGADIVFGHGPHAPLAIGHWRGRPIVYGAGGFSFQAEHGGKPLIHWTGLAVTLDLLDRRLDRASFFFVQRNDANQTVVAAPGDHADLLRRLADASAALGSRLTVEGDRVLVAPA